MRPSRYAKNGALDAYIDVYIYRDRMEECIWGSSASRAWVSPSVFCVLVVHVTIRAEAARPMRQGPGEGGLGVTRRGVVLSSRRRGVLVSELGVSETQPSAVARLPAHSGRGLSCPFESLQCCPLSPEAERGEFRVAIVKRKRCRFPNVLIFRAPLPSTPHPQAEHNRTSTTTTRRRSGSRAAIAESYYNRAAVNLRAWG